MKNINHIYEELLLTVLAKGEYKEPARNGMIPTLSYFGYQNRYNFEHGFPIINTKKINFKNILVELLWFLKGKSSIEFLSSNNCNIWNEDVYRSLKDELKENDINSYEEFLELLKKENKSIQEKHLTRTKYAYPFLWRYFDSSNPTDQLETLINNLIKSPFSRRHILSAWNPNNIDKATLPPCHTLFQFNVRVDKNTNEKILDCQLYQRSADLFLGVPYNISSYCLLMMIIGKIVNYKLGEFVHTFGDVHIYENHIEPIKKMLENDPDKYELPTLELKGLFNNIEKYFDNNKFDMNFFDDLSINDFELKNYKSFPYIKGELTVGI